MATTMQETYPALALVVLLAGDETAPILPTEFLGGSAPSLERFWLRGIPFPEVPRHLLSTRDLIHLRLHWRTYPDSGYFSPRGDDHRPVHVHEA